VDRPPGGGPPHLNDDDDPQASAAPIFGAPRRGGEIVSLTALWTARLLRLKPLHGPRPTGQRVPDSLEIPRWALSLGFLLFVLLFLAMLAFFFVSSEARAGDTGLNFDRPTKDWYQGPVRYIITHQEVKAYKSLETELDRQNFIDWFWQRRDLVPSTPENEFRDRFQQRVYEAQRKFGDTATPGWKTDMGKIYILVGPPDEVTNDLVAKSHRGMVFWTYRRPPYPDLAPNTTIAFARDKTGSFVISTSPTIDSDVARGLNFVTARQKDVNGELVVPGVRDPALVMNGVPLSQGPLETLMIAGRLQQLPPAEEEMFKSFALTREFYGAIPLDTHFDFFKAGDGSTYTTVTVGIKATAVQYRAVGSREVPDVVVFGKLVNKDNPDLVYPLAGDNNFSESETNLTAGLEDVLRFQATGGFKPGKYQLVLGVQDRVSKKIAAYRKDVDVPDYTAKELSLSSIALADTMEPTDYRQSPGKPFYLGRFKIIPKPDAVFRKSDELNIYFQIYNPAADPASGKPRLEVEYHFQLKNPDGTHAEMGAYAVKESAAQVQGYAVPLLKWPEGEYQVIIVVKDLVAGTLARNSSAFTIRE
jgi:GWxTD domain-containing protein